MREQPELPGLLQLADADHAAYGQWLGTAAGPDKALARRLNQHCARRDPPLLLETPHSAAGAAALARWASRYRASHPDTLLLLHHVGCTRESRQLHNLLFRLLAGIRQGRGLREALPSSVEARVEVLPNWLARGAAQGKLAIVISNLDALDSGEADAAMAWLPHYLPPGIRLIASAASGAAAEMLRRRGWQLEAPDLVPHAADQLDPAAAVDAAAPLLRLLWGARRGLDGDLLERREAGANRQLGQLPQLVYPGAAGWALAGPRVQDAVRRRLLRDGTEQQAVYLELAGLCNGTMPQALDALPWLLPAAGHWQALADWLGDCTVLSALLHPDRRDDLLGCWRQWGGGSELTDFYRSRLRGWRARLSASAFVALVVQLARALQELQQEPPLQLLFEQAQDVAGELESADRAALDGACGAWLNAVERRAEAEPLLRAALLAHTELLGRDHPETHTARHQLATLLEAQGELEAAGALYKETLELREQALGPRHPELIPYLSNLAAVRKAAQDFTAAKSLYQRALALAERRYGNGHPTAAACLDNLAGLLYAGNDHEQAETLYQRALGVVESAFGPDHPATAASLHNLATLLDAREQFRTAEQLFRRALAIRQDAYGDDHADTASTLHNLAGTLDAMGDARQAEPLYRRAAETWEKLVGREHPATATSINNLADLLREKGEYEEAEMLYKRNLASWTALLGEEHPHTLMTLAELAGLYADQGRTDTAEPMLRQALDQTGRILGTDSMLHIDSALRLGALLRDSGRREEAIRLLRQTVAQAEGKLSLLSPRLQKLRRHLDALEADPAALH